MYFDKKRIEQRTANISQLVSVQESVIDNGPGKGVKIIDVDNGTGLRAVIHVDRGMDIGRCTFRGVPVSFETPSGLVHPAYYNPYGKNWLRTWPGGMMTGTGLRNVGVDPQGEDFTDPLGLHGRLSHTPATLLSIEKKWEDDKYVVKITGIVKECSFFDDTLSLKRTITIESVTNKIVIDDFIVNEGARECPMMLLYHFNFGYPFLDDNTYIDCFYSFVEPLDKQAKSGIDEWNKMAPPEDNILEKCYSLSLISNYNNYNIEVIAPDLPFFVEISWDKKELPFTTIWKMLGKKEYALGIEPANCHPVGRKKEKQRGTLCVLSPDEEKHTHIELNFKDR